MKDESRIGVAVAIIFAAVLLYPMYLKWVSPPQPVRETQEAASAERPTLSKTVNPSESSPAENLPAKNLNEELFDYENESLSITFSTLGGTIKHLEAKKFAKLHNNDAVLIDIEKNLRGSYALLFPFEKSDIDRRNFKRDKSLEKDENTVAFTIVKDGTLKITKLYRLLHGESALELEVIFENISASEQKIQTELSTQLYFNAKEAEGYDQGSLEAGARIKNKIECKNIGHIQKKGYLVEGDAEWIFASKKYFVLITEGAAGTFARSRTIKLNANEMANFALLPEMDLAPSEKISKKFLLYTGAKEYNALKSFGQHFEDLLSKGFFGVFRIWLLLALQFFFHWVHNWGWAIVIITVLIKLAFTPLTHISFDSMKKMQALQPKMKAIQEKYKKDPQQLNKEMMAFYKKHKVNPMAGCLPMLLQMPIFIALYQVLYQAIELKGAPWILWVKDLSAPDKLFTLPFSLPFLGDGFNVLPLIMIISMVWQQKLTPMSGPPEQQKVMAFMPIIFGVMFYSLPSGLVLYWTVNNFLTVFHQEVIKRYFPHPVHPDEK